MILFLLIQTEYEGSDIAEKFICNLLSAMIALILDCFINLIRLSANNALKQQKSAK